MESEHTHISSAQPDQGVSDQKDTTYTTPAPEHHAQPEQETPAGESAQNEANSASRHRRRRTARASARRSRSDTTEEISEIAEHAEERAEAASQGELPQPGAEVNEPVSDGESAAPVGDLWPPAVEPEPPPASPEMWEFQHWREQPPADWNPFFPQASATPPAFTPPTDPDDIMSDFEATALGSPPPEVALEGNEEVIASTPASEALPAAPAAPIMPGQAGVETPETVRAPLSGVEVRPPRRYRFDRPSPATREATAREATQAVPQPAPSPEAPAGEAPSEPAPTAAPGTGKKRGAAPAADKAAGAEAPPNNRLGGVIEREITETPEIETDVAAAEDLARATQAALEAEVAEALESFAASTEQPHAPRSGRRRRRRSGSSAAASASAADTAEKAQPSAPQPPPAQPQTFQPYIAPLPQEYQITDGLQQLGQPQSPFAGPEPSSARGFGPVPRGVAMPAERSVRMPRPERTVETGNVSANQLAMIFTQAIQQQTDRLLMELRRSQGTPSMTVNFPPMPSNERVGVFVDVANLLYSARNMRIAIDFGRLLDFLRGNRRLVRAHAYCPTSPDPRAEQMFLDAVKGLGYRITTKNYKTFSSGAKKADLDLDLCMDVVRLVDAGALDCISLVSGDSDFLPLLEYCSDHGVRVEVAAFDEATASILRQSCDLFINLSMVEEIRA